jgi:hypothetical protein
MTARAAIAVEPLDEAVDHLRGPSAGHQILEYGDHECPYARVESGLASGPVTGTATLLIDGVVHRGGYDAAQLSEAFGRP